MCDQCEHWKREKHFSDQAASDAGDWFDSLVRNLAAILNVDEKPSTIIQEVTRLKLITINKND